MILKQVNTFRNLGCNISYQEEKGIQYIIKKTLQILGLLNNRLTFKPHVVQNMRLKLYKQPFQPLYSFIHSQTPYGPGRTFGLPFRGFLITHIQTHGRTSDQPVAEASTYAGQHSI
jgi:hypothetical protein